MLAHDRNYVAILKDPLNLALKKGFCSTVKDMGSFYKFFPHLINETIVIVLQMADTIKVMREGGAPLNDT